MPNKLFVVDLDGTLIRANSFHFFIITLIKLSLFNRSFYSIFCFFKIIIFALLRKLRIFSHDRLKKELQKIWLGYEDLGYYRVLSDKVKDYVDRELRTELVDFLISEKSNGDVVIIATAAPEEYVNIIAGFLPIIDFVVATPKATSEAWFHNINEKKWENIKSNFPVKDFFIVSFTDHIDDLPLIQNSDEAYLFEPLSGNLQNLKEKVTTKIIGFYD